jgi:hypothetical protein
MRAKKCFTRRHGGTASVKDEDKYWLAHTLKREGMDECK